MTQPDSSAPTVDMSAEAIDRRLRIVAELWRFGLALRSAKRIGPINEGIARQGMMRQGLVPHQ